MTTNDATDNPSRGASDNTVVPFTRGRLASGPTPATAAVPSIPGRHYTYANYVAGLRPVTWSRSESIPVVLIGTVPPSADDILDRAIATIASVTSLPLRREDNAAAVARGITIEFVDFEGLARRIGRSIRALRGRARGHTEMSVNALGRYEQAFVAVLQDDDPSPTGRDLQHQLGHAIGLGHPFSSRALMSAAPDPDVLRYGLHDMHGLQSLYASQHGRDHRNGRSVCISSGARGGRLGR